MKKRNFFFGFLVLFLGIVLAASLFTLTLHPVDTSQGEHDGGKWAEVCCGSMCQGGNDYCLGTGDLICCK